MARYNAQRRMLESAAKAGAVAIGMNPATQLDFPNIVGSFDRTRVTEYVRVTVSELARVPRTMGRQPRMEKTGMVQLGIFVRTGTGQDRADEIAGEQGSVADPTTGSGILKAFPYAAQLARDGVTVSVDNAERGGDAVEVDGWWYLPWKVNWSTWNSP